MSYAVVPRAGVGWLPVFSWIGSLVGQKYGAHTASTVATAQQAAQEVVSSSALPTTTGPEQAQLFDLFKACANPLATVAGYRQVPMTAPTAPGAPLNSPKTCGLAKDPVSAGCPYRDYVLAFCTRAGEQFEPLTKMTTEEREVFQAEAAKRVAQENAEAAKKPSGFWDSPATLGVAAVVVGTLVFMEYRRRNQPKKNPRHRPRRNGKTFREAVLTRDAAACARIADMIRHKYHGRYKEILATAQQIDPTLTAAEWDALLREGEED